MEMKIEIIQAPCYYVAVNDKKEIIQGHELQYHEEGQRVIAYNQNNPIFILKGETEEAVNELLNNFEAYSWLHSERTIRVVVSEAANKQLTMHPTLHKFIPYVYLMGIPKYDTIRGIEVYLEEILPMSEELYTADLVKAELIKYGCKFEDKAL